MSVSRPNDGGGGGARVTSHHRRSLSVDADGRAEVKAAECRRSDGLR